MSVQASPKHTLKIQPKRSNSSELQMPSHWEERSTVATADDESDHTEQQVRMLMTKHLLIKQLSRWHTPGLHAPSGTLRAITSL